jgi:hypothetical protein
MICEHCMGSGIIRDTNLRVTVERGLPGDSDYHMVKQESVNSGECDALTLNRLFDTASQVFLSAERNMAGKR